MICINNWRERGKRWEKGYLYKRDKDDQWNGKSGRSEEGKKKMVFPAKGRIVLWHIFCGWRQLLKVRLNGRGGEILEPLEELR